MHFKPKCTALQSYVYKQSVTDANSVLRSVINASISASLRLLELFLIVSLTNSRNIKSEKWEQSVVIHVLHFGLLFDSLASE